MTVTETQRQRISLANPEYRAGVIDKLSALFRARTTERSGQRWVRRPLGAATALDIGASREVQDYASARLAEAGSSRRLFRLAELERQYQFR
ncbi:MAG: hypothetical protein RH942_02875 [Kiloniellaceae bacterium]